jgi:hypothetical protein
MGEIYSIFGSSLPTQDGQLVIEVLAFARNLLWFKLREKPMMPM